MFYLSFFFFILLFQNKIYITNAPAPISRTFAFTSYLRVSLPKMAKKSSYLHPTGLLSTCTSGKDSNIS